MKIEGSGDDKWQPEVVQLLQKAMEERGWEDGKYLIDGFPRTAARASFSFFEGFAGKTLAEFAGVSTICKDGTTSLVRRRMQWCSFLFLCQLA